MRKEDIKKIIKIIEASKEVDADTKDYLIDKMEQIDPSIMTREVEAEYNKKLREEVKEYLATEKEDIPTMSDFSEERKTEALTRIEALTDAKIDEFNELNNIAPSEDLDWVIIDIYENILYRPTKEELDILFNRV